MAGTLQHIGGGSWVIHEVDEGQVRVMTRALAAESRRRAARRAPTLPGGEPVTISERSHPRLFAMLGEGRAQFSLRAPRPSDIDLAEADAVHMVSSALAEKYDFLAPSNTHAGFSPRG